METSSRRIALRRILGLCFIASWVLLSSPSGLAKDSGKGAMKFAADMAARGNWREASFRWEKLLSSDAGNAKLYNNLAVACEAIGELDLAKTNVNGGAIALGHPVGATGARLLLTAAHELHAGDHELTLATLCIGGGQGGAVLLERMQ